MIFNILFNKYRVRVFISQPLQSDGLAQAETFAPPIYIRANIQLDKASSPTSPVVAGPHGGKLFTLERNRIKERDRIEFEGYLYLVTGVRHLYDHRTAVYHHTEATLEISQSKVE